MPLSDTAGYLPAETERPSSAPRPAVAVGAQGVPDAGILRLQQEMVSKLPCEWAQLLVIGRKHITIDCWQPTFFQN